MDKQWACWALQMPSVTQVFTADTATKAKARAYALMHELGWPVAYTDVRCRRVS